MGVAAEANGWDGVFLWHHVVGTPDFPVPMSDAWVLLGALAVATRTIRIGTTVTALPRHQPQEVARQSVTIDRLCGGRMVLGVGLGEPPTEYSALGRSADRTLLAQMLDESLGVVAGLWTGQPFSHRGAHYRLDDVQFLPPPSQGPRIPVWVSALERNDRTLGRAARWDGAILGVMTADGGIDVLDPDVVTEVAARPDAPTDIVVAAPAGIDVTAYQDSGATWVLITGWIDELPAIAQSAAPTAHGTQRDSRLGEPCRAGWDGRGGREPCRALFCRSATASPDLRIDAHAIDFGRQRGPRVLGRGRSSRVSCPRAGSERESCRCAGRGKAIDMTAQESFKRRIRARMAKTGERYGAARRALISQAIRTDGRAWVSQPETSDEAVRAATGCGWDEWCATIDDHPVRERGHTAIAAHVRDLGIDAWWAQSVTVGYERIRGLRLPYQNHDGTFTASRTKTITVDAATLRAVLLDDTERAVLFPAFETGLRSRPASKNVRLSIGASMVEIALAPAAGERTKVTVAHSRLATADEVTIWKQFWTDWIDNLDERA